METVMQKIMEKDNFNQNITYNSKESINKRLRTEKKICECGGCYTYKNYSSHYNTNRHINFIIK